MYCCEKFGKTVEGNSRIRFDFSSGYYIIKGDRDSEDIVLHYCPFCGKEAKQ